MKKRTRLLPRLDGRRCLLALAGSLILAFGLYEIHSFAGVTEGGVLGLTLLFHHWFHISPAASGFVMNALCYLIGSITLGREFIGYSVIAGGGFSAFYALIELTPPLWPDLGESKLAAAVIGAVFVGIGAGLSVRAGGAPGGDDALAMTLQHITHIPIEWIYLISDLIVLALSLTYIPLGDILYSLLTVILSGQILGWVQKVGRKKARKAMQC